ncbi:MAG: hypothetical protein HZB67_06245 [Candidatus Aenigmarchaeota archaeon]|nr:hypothetical protein [Candidatus Aenigmarchaeota archaeon]
MADKEGWSGLLRFFEYIGWKAEMEKGPSPGQGAQPGEILIGTIVAPFDEKVNRRGVPIISIPISLLPFLRKVAIYGEMFKNLRGGTLVEPRVPEEPYRGPPIFYGKTKEEQIHEKEQAEKEPREPALPRYALGLDCPEYAGRLNRDSYTRRMIFDKGAYRWLQ